MSLRKILLLGLIFSAVITTLYSSNAFARGRATNVSFEHEQNAPKSYGTFVYPTGHKEKKQPQKGLSPLDLNLNPVCGGTKYGSTWQTWPTGGYVGDGCGAGIDYVSVPAPTGTVSLYTFGVENGVSGLTYSLWAWIPTVKATAVLRYSIYVCGLSTGYDSINEAPVSGWQYLGTLITGNDYCDVAVYAYPDPSSPNGSDLGLDAFDFDPGA